MNLLKNYNKNKLFIKNLVYNSFLGCVSVYFTIVMFFDITSIFEKEFWVNLFVILAILLLWYIFDIRFFIKITNQDDFKEVPKYKKILREFLISLYLNIPTIILLSLYSSTTSTGFGGLAAIGIYVVIDVPITIYLLMNISKFVNNKQSFLDRLLKIKIIN